MPTINMAIYNDLLALLGEDYHDLIEALLLDTPPHLTSLSSSVNESDFKEIFRIAHFLIGSSGNLGLEKFSNICNQLCLHSQNEDIDSCIKLEKLLLESFNEAEILLTEKLNSK